MDPWHNVRVMNDDQRGHRSCPTPQQKMPYRPKHGHSFIIPFYKAQDLTKWKRARASCLVQMCIKHGVCPSVDDSLKVKTR